VLLDDSPMTMSGGVDQCWPVVVVGSDAVGGVAASSAALNALATAIAGGVGSGFSKGSGSGCLRLCGDRRRFGSSFMTMSGEFSSLWLRGEVGERCGVN
jgi:hypothetical protein